MPLAQLAILFHDRFGHAAHRPQLTLECGDAPSSSLQIKCLKRLGQSVEPQAELLCPGRAAVRFGFHLGCLGDLGVQALDLVRCALRGHVTCLTHLMCRALCRAQHAEPLLSQLSFGQQIHATRLGRFQLTLDRRQLGLHRVQLARELAFALRDLGLLAAQACKASAGGFTGNGVGRHL